MEPCQLLHGRQAPAAGCPDFPGPTVFIRLGLTASRARHPGCTVPPAHHLACTSRYTSLKYRRYRFLCIAATPPRCWSVSCRRLPNAIVNGSTATAEEGGLQQLEAKHCIPLASLLALRWSLGRKASAALPVQLEVGAEALGLYQLDRQSRQQQRQEKGRASFRLSTTTGKSIGASPGIICAPSQSGLSCTTFGGKRDF